MALKVNVNTKNLDGFTRRLSVSGTKAERITEEAAPAIGNIIAEMIMAKMSELASGDGKEARFWKFMAARTAINVQWSGGTVIVTVSGLAEGEVPNASDSRTGADTDANLWEAQEFGSAYNGQEGKLQVFLKDAGGKLVFTRKTASKDVSPNKRRGSVNRLVQSLRLQIETSAQIIAAIQGHTAVAQVIEEAAPRGSIEIDKRARTALKRASVDEAMLASLGVEKVVVMGSGQISLMGHNTAGSMRFIAGKDFGIPTTIRRK